MLNMFYPYRLKVQIFLDLGLILILICEFDLQISFLS